MRVCITTEVERWDSSYDSYSTEGEVSNVVAYATDKEYPTYGESLCEEFAGLSVGDTIYAVVVDYSTGDSFSHSGGHGKVMGAFDNIEEAVELGKLLESSDSSEYSVTYKDKEYCCGSWKGYFESVNSIDVWECTVKPNRDFPLSSSSSIGVKRGT